MALDPVMRPASPVVFADKAGVHLVAVPDDPARPDRWESYKVDDRGTHGPNLLGNWVRFNPSDYARGQLPPSARGRGPGRPALPDLIGSSGQFASRYLARCPSRAGARLR